SSDVCSSDLLRQNSTSTSVVRVMITLTFSSRVSRASLSFLETSSTKSFSLDLLPIAPGLLPPCPGSSTTTNGRLFAGGSSNWAEGVKERKIKEVVIKAKAKQVFLTLFRRFILLFFYNFAL